MAKVNLNKDIIGVLDIGSTKVCCIIAKSDIKGNLNILGVGYQLSNGVSKGHITNINMLESSIRAVVCDAEEMSDVRLEKVFININSVNLQSYKAEAEMYVSSSPIGEDDVIKVIEDINKKVNIGDRDIIHCITTGYSIDGSNGISDPRGMHGDRLGVHFHLVSSSIPHSKNLNNILEKCHLGIENKVASSYASGLSCLVEDEKSLGSILIDMGGGVTSISVFKNGHLDFVGAIPLGGANVTKDIAICLSTSLIDAEKIKIKYGTVILEPNSNYEYIKVPLVGEEDEVNLLEIKKSELVGIIRPRVEDIFIEIRYMLERCGFGNSSFKRVVITGGASQLSGIKEFAENQLSSKVRIARPKIIKDLPESFSGPSFSTSLGLLEYAINEHFINKDKKAILSNNRKFSFTKIGDWIRKNF